MVLFLISAFIFWGVVVAVRSPAVVYAAWFLDGKGQLVWEQEGEVLGKNTGEERSDSIKTEIRSAGSRVVLERKDGRMMIRTETEEGGQEEMGEQKKFEIREKEDKDKIEVETEGEEFVMRRGQTEAITRFPLSVNVATNEVLPDQAVQNLLGTNVIDALQTEAASPRGALAAGVITLGERLGLPVYEIPGVKHLKLFGFIPLQTQVTAVVSAETGELVATENVGLMEKLVNLLSID